MDRYLKWVLISIFSFIILHLLFEDYSWSFVFAIGIGWYFSRSKNNTKNIKTIPNLPMNDEKNENGMQEEIKEAGSEAARVRKEADKIKERAMDSGIPQLISELYHQDIHYYPSWITHTPRDYVPDSITEATKLKEGKDNKDCILLKMKGQEYKFIYKENFLSVHGDDSSFGDLELFANDKKILHINETVYYNEWGVDHKPISVDAFILGEWVNDFKELKNEIQKAEELRKKKVFENPKEIEKLKKNFDIK
jgi:hypothetical protein